LQIVNNKPVLNEVEWIEMAQLHPNRTHAHLTQRVTGHGARFMKNEPNYNTENRKSTTENRKSLQILLKKNLKNSSNLQQFVSLSLRKSALFFTFSQLFIRIYKQMHAFCKLLKITYLTPCTSKTYKTLHP
jgi:hypothetical protein